MKLLFTLCLCTISLCTAQQFTINGIVRNLSSGETLPFANVFVKDGTKGTITDVTGHYELMLTKGDYKIMASYIGYKTETIPVTVELNDITLNINLTSTDVILQEVSVYAATSATENKEVSSMSIQSEEIVQISSIANDVFRSIQSLPGLAVNNELSAKFNVRGGNFDENLVLVNGTQVYEPFHVKEADNASVGIFNMDLMKKVNLTTGGFSAQYGDRLSSVLNIEYREGNKERYSSSASASLTSFDGVYEGPLFSNGSFIIGARKSYTEYIMSLIKTDPVHISFYDIQGVASYNLTETNKLQLKFIHAGDDFSSDPETEIIPSFNSRGTVDQRPANFTIKQNSYNEEQAEYFSNMLDLQHTIFIGTNAFLTSSISYYEQIDKESDYNNDLYRNNFTVDAFPQRSYFYNSFYESRFDNILTIRTLEPKVALEMKANPFYEIKSGVSYLDIHYRQDLIDFDSTTVTQNYNQYPDTTKSVFTENYNSFPQHLRSSSFKLACYIENIFQLSDQLFLNVGGRIDYFEFNRDLTLSPRLSISYSFQNDFTVRAAWGHYYQSPIYRQLAYSFASDTNTQSQKAEHYILSLERTTAVGSDDDGLLTMKIEGYYKKYSDLISSVKTGWGEIFYSRKNDTKGFAQGIDLYLSLRTGIYYGWISYGLLSAKEDLLADSLGEFPRYTDQRHTLSVVNDIDLGKDWKMNVRFNYGSGFAYTPYVSQYNSIRKQFEWIEGKKNSEYLPAYKRIDLRISNGFTLFGVPTEAFVDVSNLLNTKNIFSYRYRFDSNGNPYREEIELWPLIPSLGLKVKF